MNEFEKNDLKNYLRDYCDARLEKSQRAKDMYVCPFCFSGTKANRTPAFHLIPGKDGNAQQYFCQSCQKTGDLYTLIMEIEHLTFSQALDRARELYGSPDTIEPMLTRIVTPTKKETVTRFIPEMTSESWQNALIPIVKRAQEVIFEDAGIKALDYLHDRGIDDETIKEHKVGYIPPVNTEKWCQDYGYSYSIPTPIPNDNKKRLAIPCGITFPYFMDGNLYKLETRRLPEQITEHADKIGTVRGCKTAIFNGDDAECSDKLRDIIFTEGVIDAMSINQVVGRWCNDEIKAVTFGSSTARSDPDEFYKWFVMPYRVIVGFDNDDAGRNNGKALATDITRARLDAGRNPAKVAFPPEKYKDWNEFLINEPRSVFQYVSDLFPVIETR